MTPAFGYLSVSATVHGADIDRIEALLRTAAQDAGHPLAAVYIDHPTAVGSAYADLMEALRRQAQAVVIVPSMEHLARLESLQHMMRLTIEQAGGRLLVLDAPLALAGAEE